MGNCGGGGTAGWRRQWDDEVEKVAMRRGGERKRNGATEVAWRKRDKMPKGKGKQKGEPRKIVFGA